MKSAAQRVARPAARTLVRPRPAPVAAAEAQARTAAAGFVRGDAGLGRTLTPAPTAGLELRGSAGRPLPTLLRGELETAFGADLGAVRVHHDADSAAAARDLGAHAFASGAHVYFAAGRFAASSASGRELIAHEIAHVLQQTGRAASGGRLASTALAGSAAVQCVAIPDFATLRPAHAPVSSNPARKKYDQVASDLDTRVKGPNPGDEVEVYAKAALPRIKPDKWPHYAESLLYDTLKHFEKFDTAAQMLERDDFVGGNRINTIAESQGLVAALEKRNGGAAVYVKAIANIEWLKKYESAWVGMFDKFLFQPADPPLIDYLPNLRSKDPASKETIRDDAHALWKQLAEDKTVSNNEWVYGGLSLLSDLDAARVKKCVEIWNASGSANLIELKAARAAGVVSLGQNLVDVFELMPLLAKRSDAADAKTALTPYMRKLGKRVEAVGQAAAAVWGEAKSLKALVQASEDKAPQGEKEAARKLVARRTLANKLALNAGLPAVLVNLLRQLNLPDDRGGRELGPLEFRERLKPLAEKLTTFWHDKLEAPQAALFSAKQTDELLALIALSVWVWDLLRLLRWLLKESPPKGKLPAVSTTDDVRAHRIRLARGMRGAAEALGWMELVTAADEILEARFEARSFVALRPFDNGDLWKLDDEPERDLVQRAQDDGVGEIHGLEPLTLVMLARFYQATFYDELARQIRKRLPQSDADETAIVTTDGATPYLVSKAFKATQVALPERWTTHEFEFAKKATDSRAFGDVLSTHPSYVELRKVHLKPGYHGILPREPRLPYVWFVPPFEDLANVLKEQKLLNELVATTFTAEKVAARRVAQASALGSGEWLDRLQGVLERKLKDPDWLKNEWPAVYRAARDASIGLLTDARTGMEREHERAMRLDRRLIARRVRANLQSFDDDHHDLASINRALRLIRQFYGANASLPENDRNLQLAVLLLEIAPLLKEALEHEQRFDIVFPFLGLMEQGLESLPSIKPLPPGKRRRLLPPREDYDSWIDARAAELTSITKTLQAVREQVQKREGFIADKDQGTINAYLKYSSPLPLGTVYQPRYGGFLGQPSQTRYKVAALARSFVYHPAYGGANPGAGLKSGYQAPQFLELDDKTSLELAPTDPLLTLEIITVHNGQWAVDRTVTLTPADAALIADLYNGILWRAFSSSMENIQAGLDHMLEFYLDAAELLPGVGHAIAAARISAALFEFVGSGDFDAILDVIGGNLKDVVDKLWAAINENLDPENLLLLVLFGNPRLDYLMAHSTLGAGQKSPSQASAAGGKVGTLKKTIEAFRRLGRAVFKALRKLETSVERPMQDVRAFASTRPLLSFALNYSADHIFQILTMVEAIQSVLSKLEDKGGTKNLADSIKSELKGQQKDFGERLTQILKALEELKLPEQIIDITPAVSKVLTFAEATIIKKAGLYGKVVSLAFKHSGAYDFLNDRIAKGIVAHGVDPNRYWLEEIVPKIEGSFNATRDALVGQINQVLASPTFKDVFDPVPSPGSMKVTTDPSQQFKETGDDYVPTKEEVDAQPPAPDTAPQPSPDRPLRMRPPAIPSFGPGARLSVDLRQGFERRLGQDLQHVRVHTGSTGAAMTAAFGADALTSGSHVFLRPGRSAAGNQELLAHELVHVTQQTGVRPLGLRHTDTPQLGHPERGLDWDPAREAQAEDVARAMKRPSETGPASPAMGLQPSGINWFTIARMMRAMSNLSEVKRRAEELKLGSSTPTKEARGIVDKVLATLKEKTTDKSVVVALKPFESMMTSVQNRLTDATYADPIAKAANEIAFEALVPSPATPGGKQHLSAGHFARQLEGYILYRTGLSFVLSLNTTKVMEGGKEYEVVDPAQPVKQFKLAHIHLPYMDGRAPFWGKAVENTWPATSHTDDYRKRMRRVLRPMLESRGIAPGIWPMFGSDYRFSLWFKLEAEKEEKQQGAKIPSPVPDWTEYVKTDENSGKDGVRLAYYDHDASQTGTGRQSHHLTQYLLADFFSNTNATKAFVASRDYPGVTLDKGQVTQIAAQDKGADKEHRIDVLATKGEGRGSNMPTISLAAVTHQRGKLHVTPEADEQPGGAAKKSQGTALANEFTRQLPAALTSTNHATYQSYFKDHSRDEAAAAIYAAAQSTYRTIERHMSKQLAANMPQLEYDYYLGLVEGTPQDIRDASKPDVTTEAQKSFLDALKAVPDKAKGHNEKNMRENFGWRLS